MANDNGNVKQRVTVAVLGHKIDTLTETVKQSIEDAKEDRKELVEQGNRVTRLEANQAELKKAARSDKIFDRIAIAAGTIVAGLWGRSN